MAPHLLSIITAGICLAGLPIVAQGQGLCADYVVSEEELQQILHDTLGNYASLVNRTEVRVDPADPACYLRISLDLKFSGCTVFGCSIAVPKGQSIGIKEFEVRGCDLIFTAFSLDRTVRTSFADARERIAVHCGPGRFDIAEAVPEVWAGSRRIRLRFAPSP